MSKKFSITSVCKFILIQLVIVAIFVVVLDESKPIDLQQTRQINITIDDVHYYKTISEFRLVVCYNSKKYTFTSRATVGDYSVRKLYDTISVGDKLSVLYYEKDGIFAKNNIIVDARTETETYRSFENYVKGKRGLSSFVIVVFVISEVIVCGAFLFYIIIWKRT